MELWRWLTLRLALGHCSRHGVDDACCCLENDGRKDELRSFPKGTFGRGFSLHFTTTPDRTLSQQIGCLWAKLASCTGVIGGKKIK